MYLLYASSEEINLNIFIACGVYDISSVAFHSCLAVPQVCTNIKFSQSNQLICFIASTSRIKKKLNGLFQHFSEVIRVTFNKLLRTFIIFFARHIRILN